MKKEKEQDYVRQKKIARTFKIWPYEKRRYDVLIKNGINISELLGAFIFIVGSRLEALNELEKNGLLEFEYPEQREGCMNRIIIELLGAAQKALK
jgi:hypothetical protein